MLRGKVTFHTKLYVKQLESIVMGIYDGKIAINFRLIIRHAKKIFRVNVYE
jgi:hypothetical protein